MPQLTPKRAALWAKWVYRIKDHQLGTEETRAGLPDFVRLDRFEAESGTRSITRVSSGVVTTSSKTGFVLFARGSKPDNKGELIVSVRGTVSGHDWLTNLNGASESFDYGPGVVHSGFYGLFRTVKDDLDKAITYVRRSSIGVMSSTPVTTVHVCGHSLGGAVANIVAAYFKTSLPNVQVILYTFGAPRVGDKNFALGLTALLGAENILRVYNDKDPVPLVPPWPFVHAPYIDEQGLAYVMTYEGGNVLKAEGHFMGTGYIPYVTNKSWDDLAAGASLTMSNTYVEQISAYLRGKESGGGLSAWAGWGARLTIDYIGQAFTSVTRQYGLGLTEAMTLPDQIAYIVNGVGVGSLSANEVFSKWVRLLVHFIGLELEQQNGANGLAEWALSDSATPLRYLGNRILGMLSAAIPDLGGDLSGEAD